MELASSSSSSSSFLKSEPQFIYDVFINFWGEDIGKKLISHLHSVLLQAQVKTLIKEENLQEGMELEEHMREIAASKIAIIVFSKSYAESTCCLLQLETIIECHELLELLYYEDLPIPEFPVGLEWHVEKVIGCIENNSNKVCMIGIWGMGGSGKTTIAKAIYNRIYRLFIGKSFIENIRQICDREGQFVLQENLILDILKIINRKLIRTMIKNELSLKKLLIVLDEVSEFGQLEKLCGSREWFGQGTVIIITTRDIRLLNRLNVDYVYKMDDVMKKKEPREHFSWLSFWRSKTNKRLE